jgi:hypothetical protein
LALVSDHESQHMEGKEPRKVIVAWPTLVSIVV